METKTSFTADPKALSDDIATLLRDEQRCGLYLDFKCGDSLSCGCLLNAASPNFGGETSDAFLALSKAPAGIAANLVRYAYGDEINLSEDELMELLPLAKKVGIDSCVSDCRKVIGKADEVQFPIALQMGLADAKQHRHMLWKFYCEGRFVDVTLRAMAAPRASDDGACDGNLKFVDFRVHRVVLAATSSYFSAMWAHCFADSPSAGSVVEVELNADIVRLLVKGLYGETITASCMQLVELFMLADRWQMFSISTPVLEKIKQHISIELASSLLKSDMANRCPSQILQMAIVEVAKMTFPTSYQVISPNAHRELNGFYRIVDGVVHNKFPIWKRGCHDDTHLFRSESGKIWILGSLERSTGKVFARTAGVLQPHQTKWHTIKNGFSAAVDSDIKVLVEGGSTGPLNDVFKNNISIAIPVLTGAITGLPSRTSDGFISCVKSPQHLQYLIETPEWLGLSVESLVQACVAMTLHDGYDNEALRNGVVAWCRQGEANIIDAFAKILLFCHTYGQTHGSDADLKLLINLSDRILHSYGDAAFALVEHIFMEHAGEIGIASASSPKKGNNTEATSSLLKRRREETDVLRSEMVDVAVVDVAAEWAKPRLKRLRTSANWSFARPAAVAAMIRACATDNDDGINAALSDWAEQATLASVLEAMQHCIEQVNAGPFRVLLHSASSKVITLDHYRERGDDGLQVALQAQRKAEAECLAARDDASKEKARADAEKVRAEAAEAEILKVREELQQRTERERQWVVDLKSKTCALLTCITAPRQDGADSAQLDAPAGA